MLSVWKQILLACSQPVAVGLHCGTWVVLVFLPLLANSDYWDQVLTVWVSLVTLFRL